jgi:hypothetical protein
MKNLGRALSVTIGLGAAVALVGHFNSGTARAVDIDRVKVVNPASDPVPVTGNVKAIQSGAWNVGINGTPTVNVASAPPVNVNFPSTISVTNPFASPSQPVPLVVTGDTVDFVTILFNGSYLQVRPDGSTTNFTLLPGQSLVITDVNWQALCTQIQGCTKAVGDQVTFFLGNFYVSTDTYKGLPLALVAGRTDHFTTGLVLTQLPTQGLLFGAAAGEIINLAILQGYVATAVH